MGEGNYDNAPSTLKSMMVVILSVQDGCVFWLQMLITAYNRYWTVRGYVILFIKIHVDDDAFTWR